VLSVCRSVGLGLKLIGSNAVLCEVVKYYISHVLGIAHLRTLRPCITFLLNFNVIKC